jgi:hypothetical protein
MSMRPGAYPRYRRGPLSLKTAEPCFQHLAPGTLHFPSLFLHTRFEQSIQNQQLPQCLSGNDRGGSTPDSNRQAQLKSAPITPAFSIRYGHANKPSKFSTIQKHRGRGVPLPGSPRSLCLPSVWSLPRYLHTSFTSRLSSYNESVMTKDRPWQ